MLKQEQCGSFIVAGNSLDFSTGDICYMILHAEFAIAAESHEAPAGLLKKECDVGSVEQRFRWLQRLCCRKSYVVASRNILNDCKNVGRSGVAPDEQYFEGSCI